MYELADPVFAKRLLQSLYFEDIITGQGDKDGAYQFHVKTKSRLAEGGFKARTFASSYKNLVYKIKENERLLERNYQSTQISTREISKTVVEEDESYAKGATHCPDTLSATEKVLGL